MNKHYILCLDEGHGPVSPTPQEGESSTALMVNPKASKSVLLDAARARVARIVDVTTPFFALEGEGADISLDDTIRLLITVCAMSEEVVRLLNAAQYHPCSPEAMLQSYLQTIEAAEKLLNAVGGNWISDAVSKAQEDLEANIAAAREDFLGKKEASA